MMTFFCNSPPFLFPRNGLSVFSPVPILPQLLVQLLYDILKDKQNKNFSTYWVFVICSWSRIIPSTALRGMYPLYSMGKVQGGSGTWLWSHSEDLPRVCLLSLTAVIQPLKVPSLERSFGIYLHATLSGISGDVIQFLNECMCVSPLPQIF